MTRRYLFLGVSKIFISLRMVTVRHLFPKRIMEKYLLLERVISRYIFFSRVTACVFNTMPTFNPRLLFIYVSYRRLTPYLIP